MEPLCTRVNLHSEGVIRQYCEYLWFRGGRGGSIVRKKYAKNANKLTVVERVPIPIRAETKKIISDEITGMINQDCNGKFVEFWRNVGLIIV